MSKDSSKPLDASSKLQIPRHSVAGIRVREQTRLLVKMCSLTIATCTLVGLISGCKSDPWQRKKDLETHERMNALAQIDNELPGWPPTVGQAWPEIELLNSDGTPLNLSQHKGKPVLIELVAMSCAACQAFSGGNTHGGYDGWAVQPNLFSIETYFSRHTGGKSLSDDGIIFLQLMVYDLNLKPVNLKDAIEWKKHFHLNRDNTFVAVAPPGLANAVTQKMIPGFLLLDSDHIVRYDATGHNPRHNLFRELLPAAGGYLDENNQASRKIIK
jgi:hypothetical protein